ncbi:unnamed protein product, partial [Darwinula stevensoni]
MVQFETFSERIGKIRVDVVHRYRDSRSIIPEDEETFFYEGVLKWKDLNCTKDFDNFLADLGPEIQTLAQVVHRQKAIIETLQEHLQKEKSLALQPLLELTVAIARDLQSDFQPYFPKFFEILTSLLETKDPERIEWTFMAVAHLYKYLWRQILKDLEGMFDLYSCLLEESRPEHIQKFAAQSFAFLFRKIPDKKAFLLRAFQKLVEHPQRKRGLGHVLSEAMKGVRHTLHTCSESLLSLILSLLNEPSLESHVVFETIEVAFQNLVLHVDQESSILIWKLLLDQVEKLSGEEGKSEEISKLLKVLKDLVSFREGSLLSDVQCILLCCSGVLFSKSQSEEVHEVTLDILSTVLKFSRLASAGDIVTNVVLSVSIQNICMGSVVLVLESQMQNATKLDFLSSLKMHSLFLTHILPLALDHIHKNLAGEKSVLHFLADLDPVYVMTSDQLQHFQPAYPLDFSIPILRSRVLKAKRKASVIDTVAEIITEAAVSYPATCEEVEILPTAISLFSRLRPSIDTTLLVNLVEKLLEIVKGEGNKMVESRRRTRSTHREAAKPGDANIDHVWLPLWLSFGALHCLEPSQLAKILDVESLRDITTRHSGDVLPLRVVDIGLAALKMFGTLQRDQLEVFYNSLRGNLQSPYGELRHLTLLILSSFPVQLPKPPEGMRDAPSSIFQICLKIERIPLRIQEYRDKLKWLQQLDFNLVQTSLPPGLKFDLVPVEYLLGMLYEDLQPLWEPVQGLLASHAISLPPSEFWSLFSPTLQKAYQDLSSPVSPSIPPSTIYQSGFPRELYIEAGRKHQGKEPDVSNFHLLLWKCLKLFPHIVEMYNRDIIPLFLSFIKMHYYKRDKGASWSQDYRRKPEEMDQNKDEKDPVEEKKPQRPPKPAILVMEAALEVFSRFSDPRSISQESDVHCVFLQFLMHGKPGIQKLALDCLMAYRNKDLLPYREALYGLVEEKTFRTQLTAFNVDRDAEIVRDEHRQSLFPILLRLLYGKMIQGGGKGKGKGGVKARRALILRFLAACQEAEFSLFLDLALGHFSSRISVHGSVRTMIKCIMETTEPSSSVPLSRLRSTLNLLGLIIAKVGNLLEGNVKHVLRILIFTAATISALLKQHMELDPHVLAPLRDLRSLALNCITQFFDTFHLYPWNFEDVDALFEVAIWPRLPKLVVEGIHGPTALLRLFSTWTQNPRYFPLLMKHHPSDPALSPLPHVYGLLTQEKAVSSVKDFILDMTHNLLTLADYDPAADEEDVKPAPEIVLQGCIHMPSPNRIMQ